MLTTGTVVRHDPTRAFHGIEPGQRVALDAEQVRRLATAFLDRLEAGSLED